MLDGWAGLDPQPANQKKPSAPEVDIAGDFHALFSSELGQRCLGHMRRRTTEQPVFVTALNGSGALDGVAMAILSALRDGENNYQRWIELQVKRGATNPHERQ